DSGRPRSGCPEAAVPSDGKPSPAPPTPAVEGASEARSQEVVTSKLASIVVQAPECRVSPESSQDKVEVMKEKEKAAVQEDQVVQGETKEEAVASVEASAIRAISAGLEATAGLEELPTSKPCAGEPKAEATVTLQRLCVRPAIVDSKASDSSLGTNQPVPVQQPLFEDGRTSPAGDSVDEEMSIVTVTDKTKVLEYTGRLDDYSDVRRYSLLTVTDPNLQTVQSFSSKEVMRCGQVSDLRSEGIGFACKKGLKPESPNQDSFLVLKMEGVFAIYGVFDGHGKMGHDLSNFVKETLPKLMLAQSNLLVDPLGAMRRAFARTQELVVQ
ncbi:unnamed protein product, partial [Polarella glacialis]